MRLRPGPAFLALVLLSLGRPGAGCAADADCRCLAAPGGPFSLFGQCADVSSPSTQPAHECRKERHEQCGCNAAGACELRCMAFDDRSAAEIVDDVLRDPGGFIEVRNVTASDHACFKHFERGDVMGVHQDTNESVSGDPRCDACRAMQADRCLDVRRPGRGRLGLLVGAYTALVVALFYVVAMVVELGSDLDYVADHGDAMYLSDAEVAALKQVLPLLFVALAALTAIEIGR